MNPSPTLIIFVKNPVSGKVKTRLAATIGKEKALAIYRKLIRRTVEITEKLLVNKKVYYSDSIDKNDEWDSSVYGKELQHGANLGIRMSAAFKNELDNNEGPVAIIGSDCYQLEMEGIEMAFEKLEEHDLVIGPSVDGGYYLLAMKRFIPELFENISWSTEKVMGQTLKVCKDIGLSYSLLQTLNDVDTEDDLYTLK